MADMAQATAFFAKNHYPVTASASGVNQIIAGQPGYKIRVLNYIIVAAGAVNVKFQSGASTDLTGTMALNTNTGVSAASAVHGWFSTAPGDDLNLTLDANVSVGGHVTVEIYPATVAS